MADPICCETIQKSIDFFDYAERHDLAQIKLHIGSKRPVGNRWQNLSSTDPAEWALWKTLSFNTGVDARMSRLVIVDPDAADGKKGLQNWEEWCRSKGLNPDDYPAHVATARDGRHIFFRIPDGVTVSGASERIQDVDIIVKGQTVAPGSYFDGTSEGKQSGWYTMLSDAPPHPMPDALLALCTRKPREEAGPGSDDFSLADMDRRCTYLAEADGLSDEFDWIKMVWAVRSTFGDGGWPLAEKLSYADDKDRLAGVWAREDSSKDNPSTCASLIKLSNDLGYREWHRGHMFDGLVEQIAANAGAALVPAGPLPPGVPRPGPCDDYGDEEAAASSAPLLPIFCAASLEGQLVPPRRWHVRDLIPAQTVTLIYGDGGSGKSLLALQLLVSTAIGRPWIGRIVEKGACLFVTAEDSRDEVHRRLSDIARENAVPLSAMADLHIVSLAGEDATIAAPEGRSNVISITPLFAAIEEQIAALRPILVVLDTLADLFGGNEIDRSQARQFIGLLRGLALRYNCAIVVLAHPSLSGMDRGTSGSTGWGNSVRSRLQFARVHESDGREADEDARVLRVGKSNYGRVGLAIPMRWHEGVFVADRMTAGGDPLVREAKADRVFLELLAKYTGQNQPVGVSKGTSYAPAIFKHDAQVMGVSNDEIRAAMKRLLDAGKIENAPYGAPSKKTFRLYCAPNRKVVS